MKIVFIGFIDSKNIGDLLIAKTLEEKLMRGTEVVKYSFNFTPERDINTVREEAPKDNDYKLILKNIYGNYFRKIDIIDRIHLVKMKKRIDNNQYLNELIKDIKSCDLLIIGGGNAIFDLTKHSLSAYKFSKIFEIAKLYNKKTFVTSVGIGPFKTKKQIEYTINTLNNADYITVRDKKSFNYIKTLCGKVSLSIDPVFLLDKQTDDNLKMDDYKAEISICILDLLLNKDSSKKYKEYINNFVKLINLLSNENYKINLFSTEPRDYRAVQDVHNLLEKRDNINLINIHDFDDLMKLYSHTDLIIGTRMHSMIIGLSQFIPVIGLSWQDKVEEMFEMINLSEDVFSINEFSHNIHHILKLVDKKLNDNQSKKQLQKIKNENEEKFDINIKLINNLFESISKKQRNNENGI